MNTIVYLIAAFFSIYFASVAQAADISEKTVKVVDDYLASIKSLESEFIQADAGGNLRDGVIYIKKPNRIRIEYLTPEKELILLNDELVMHHTPDLDETNYVPGEELAMSLLSKKNFRVIKEAKIQRFEVTDKIIELDFTIKSDKQKRTTSLRLANNPIRLESISIIHGSDFVRIDFINPVINSKINSWKFNFENRRIGK